MNRPTLGQGALIGAITSLPILAILYLANQVANLLFVPFDVFDWLARVLPGGIVTAGIDAIVGLINLLNFGNTSQTAKTIEQLQALILFIIAGSLLGILVAGIFRGTNWTWLQTGLLGGLIAFVLVLFIELGLGAMDRLFIDVTWLFIIFVGWGLALGALLAQFVVLAVDTESPNAEGAARRDLIIRIAASSAGIALGAWGIGKLLDRPEQQLGANQTLQALPSVPPPATPTSGNNVTQAAPSATSDQIAAVTTRDYLQPAPGTRPELTSNEEFYRIDINTRAQEINQDSWELQVDGLFENPRNLTLDELMSFPAATQPITLSCISNRVGGDLIGTSNWTGLRVRDLLSDLGFSPEARSLVVEAVDGFFETVVMEDLMDPRTLLVYGMNGETLPTDHGFPLRIYIPDRYGMKQPKWITRISAVDNEPEGYWVKRGWSKEARPRIVSVIDTVAKDQPTAEGLVPIGGIAWAGERGIQRVELQIDDGTWLETSLRTPPLGPLTWIQWRYDWEATDGAHKIRVRATDGMGNLQIEDSNPVRPNGATGYHSVTARI